MKLFVQRISFVTMMRAAVFLCACFFFTAHTHAANRYWVGTTNRWETTANWAATSGGAGGQSVPSSSDIAIFDGGGSSDALARSALNVAGMLFANTTGKTLSLGTGSLRVGASGLRMGDGTLRASGRPVSIAGNITQTGGYLLELTSTLSVSGNILLDNASGGLYATGTILFNGNTNQSFINDQSGFPSTILVRNSGSSGSNKVTFECEGLCGLGFFSRPTLNVERGVADFDTYANIIGILGGNLIIGTGSTTASLVTDNNIILSGSVIVGDNGTLTMSGSANLVFSGTGTMTLDTNSTSLPSLILNPNAFANIDDDIAGLDGPAQVVLASNQRVGTLFSIGNACSINLSSYTLAATGATITNTGTINENTGKIVHTASNLANKDLNYATTTTEVGIGNKLYITIDESDANLNGTSQNTLSVTITTAEGDSETLTLTETGNATGVFRGSIPTAFTSAITTSDGAIQLISASTTVTISYTDSQDGLSNSTLVTLTTSTSGSSSSASNAGGGGGGRRTSSLAAPPVGASPAVTGTLKKSMTLKEKVESRKAMRHAKLKEVIEKRKQARLSRKK